mmetsp:Transcript_9967/g.25757  ORF Transcript_9967/g.25757 Transcript_9967/m.25757 type:complete len:182 (+) Transcript_9967:2-547(+)
MGCRLAALPERPFAHLGELRVLNLEFNKLKVLPASAFEGLAKLKVLWLTGNHYGGDEPEYERMRKAGNRLEALHKDVFAGLHNLQVLLLHHNRLTSLPEGIFRDMDRLKVLKLLDNRFKPRLANDDAVFAPLKAVYQLDLRQDSGDDLEDLWESTHTYLSDEFFEGPPSNPRLQRPPTREL